MTPKSEHATIETRCSFPQSPRDPLVPLQQRATGPTQGGVSCNRRYQVTEAQDKDGNDQTLMLIMISDKPALAFRGSAIPPAFRFALSVPTHVPRRQPLPSLPCIRSKIRISCDMQDMVFDEEADFTKRRSLCEYHPSAPPRQNMPARAAHASQSHCRPDIVVEIHHGRRQNHTGPQHVAMAMCPSPVREIKGSPEAHT